MGNIINTLRKVKDKVKPLLVEMFPDAEEAINFQYEDDFQEWFGMLFKISEWNLRPGWIDIKHLEMSETKTAKSLKELKSYEGLEDFGVISTVYMEDNFHLVDGYHRVLIAEQRGLLQLKGCIWEKKPNNHENCEKIRDLIIKNL